MAILTHAKIIGEVRSGGIDVDPFDPTAVGPNSLDVRLGRELFLLARSLLMDPLDPPKVEGLRQLPPLLVGDGGHLRSPTSPFSPDHDCRSYRLLLEPRQRFVAPPHVLMLGHTAERVATDRFVPELKGKSTTARLGVMPHVQAGAGDLGFGGQWTLEIYCLQPAFLAEGMRIAQFWFHPPEGEVTLLYGRDRGRYHGQTGPTPARPERTYAEASDQ